MILAKVRCALLRLSFKQLGCSNTQNVLLHYNIFIRHINIRLKLTCTQQPEEVLRHGETLLKAKW